MFSVPSAPPAKVSITDGSQQSRPSSSTSIVKAEPEEDADNSGLGLGFGFGFANMMCMASASETMPAQPTKNGRRNQNKLGTKGIKGRERKERSQRCEPKTWAGETAKVFGCHQHKRHCRVRGIYRRERAFFRRQVGYTYEIHYPLGR